MTEAEQDIADLDDEIARNGQDIILRRVVANAPAIEKPFRAFVRGYRPAELVGGINQGETDITMSPTNLPVEFADADNTRLRRDDKITFDGRTRTVIAIEPVRVGPVLVRMNVTVIG